MPDETKQHTTTAATTPAVLFNVGGRLYEVSRSLLEEHPETLLFAQAFDRDDDAASATTTAPPIFVERDAERFRYVLDYLRDDGVVDLPITVSKRALLRDLAYLGVEVVDPSGIREAEVPKPRDSTPEPSACKLPLPVYVSAMECFDDDDEPSSFSAASPQDMDEEGKLLKLAKHCVHHYKTTGSIQGIPVSEGSTQVEQELYQLAEQIYNGDSKALRRFHAVLGRVGLCLCGTSKRKTFADPNDCVQYALSLRLRKFSSSDATGVDPTVFEACHDRLDETIAALENEASLLKLVRHTVGWYQTTRAVVRVSIARGTTPDDRELYAVAHKVCNGCRKTLPAFVAILLKVGWKLCGMERKTNQNSRDSGSLDEEDSKGEGETTEYLLSFCPLDLDPSEIQT